ncbi:MAG: hypothetical protein WCX31_11215 [Salinivirgaceae bacterium]|jgi:hypothetical protein
MKKIAFILSIILQCFILTGQAQTNIENDTTIKNNISLKTIESNVENLIYTYSGNIFTGNNFDVLNENGYAYMIIDSLKVELSHIKFIKYNNYFWANTNKIENKGKNYFALRTHTGSINLFTKVELRVNTNFTNIYLSSNQMWGDYTKKIESHNLNYYNKGYGDLQSLKYKNLVISCSDNQESMTILNEAKMYSERSTIFYLAGATSIIFGFINSINHNDSSSDFIHSKGFSVYLPIGIGIGSIWLGSKMSKRKSELLLKSVEVYK